MRKILGTMSILVFSTTPVHAQSHSISVVPRVGIHTAEGSRVALGRFEPNFSSPIRSGGAAFNESVVVGVGVEIDVPPSWLDLRLVLDRTVGAEITSTDAPFRSEANLTAIGTDLLIYPISTIKLARPLLVIGWGTTRFAMENQVPNTLVLEESRLEGALRLAIGLDLSLGPSILRLEAMDSIGLVGIDSKPFIPGSPTMQATLGGGVPNDFLITAGVLIPIY